MSKKFLIGIILFLTLFMVGCDRLINNEIYNKSYNVEIDIKEFEDLVVAAVEKASPAVIGVNNYESSLTGYTLVDIGSGIVYECDAYLKDGSVEDDCQKTINYENTIDYYQYKVVTNRHVILKNELNSKVKVYLGEENLKIDAKVLGYDDKVDIAVLTFNHTKYIQPLSFADSDAVKKGSFAIAIGHPDGYEYYGSATFGIVSHPKRYMGDDTDGDGVDDWDSEYIQHDVAINPGNSGGALLNLQGEVIGINTLKIIKEETDNMGFAIPSNIIKELIPLLEKGQKPTRYTLGISVYEIDALINKEDYLEGSVPDIEVPENITYGLYVDSIDDTGYAHGKLEVGDIILEINDVKITKTQDFRAELGMVLSGEDVLFKVFRDGKELEVVIVF